MNVHNMTFSDTEVAGSTRIISVDTEPANIVSLSGDGLLLPSQQADFGEELAYDYSPLNEW